MTAVELYHDGVFPRERSLQVIDVALSAGCSIDEPDEVGSTPLVAAILFNEPELVRLLLQRGADPYRRIVSPLKFTNGLDAFGFLVQMQEKRPAENRQAIQTELERYRRSQ
ncbi:Ankyrin repeats (3 copies) [compost metagenome]